MLKRDSDDQFTTAVTEAPNVSLAHLAIITTYNLEKGVSDIREHNL